MGDDILNPPNPRRPVGEDEELYNIEPFLSQGDTVMRIDSADPDCVPPNLPPVADAHGTYSGDEGSAISIDGSGSSDPEGDPLTYTWSYKAGAGVDAGANCTFGDASAASTTINCKDDGKYDLTLTANDGTVSGSDQTTVDVAGVLPPFPPCSLPPDKVVKAFCKKYRAGSRDFHYTLQLIP